MPLNARSISVSVAVICFFGIAVISWINGLSSFACCKRALAATIIMYIVTSLAVKVINAILISAMINYQMNQQKEAANDSGN